MKESGWKKYQPKQIWRYAKMYWKLRQQRRYSEAKRVLMIYQYPLFWIPTLGFVVLWGAAKADIVMQASQIIANHIRVLLTTPLLIEFLRLSKQNGQAWIYQLISRLKGVLNSNSPEIWQMRIDQDSAPALCHQSKPVNL
ncbi:MAG: hypothetical protein ABFS56_23900 [Pseudomonadota bacterium]